MMPVVINKKWFLDRPHVIKRIGQGRARSLRKAGAMVFRSCQKQFRTGTPGRGSKVSTVRVGTYRGLPLYERRTRSPAPDRVTSWKTNRSPKGFMRSMMGFAWDSVSNSVVVGPRGAPWLNVLHERGGVQIQRLFLRFRGRRVPTPTPTGRRRVGTRNGFSYIGTFVNPRAAAPSFVPTGVSRAIVVRPGEYQKRGLEKVRHKIPKQFQGQIHGP